MAALSADTPREIKGAKTYSFKIKNASQLYMGSFASIDSTGYLIPFGGAAGEKLMGRVLPTPASADLSNPLKGNTSLSPIPEATVVMEDEIVCKVAVTGASAITDIGTVVYLNSTDNDLTFTRPARGVPFGTVIRWWSSTTCDVHRFSKEALDVLGLTGNGAENVLVMSGAILDLTSADFTIATPPYAGTISSISATVVKACTTGTSASVTLQPKIGTTLTTGGVVTITTTGGNGGTAGDVLAGTAITAANTFSESSALKVTATLTGTFTAGSFNLYVKYAKRVGL